MDAIASMRDDAIRPAVRPNSTNTTEAMHPRLSMARTADVTSSALIGLVLSLKVDHLPVNVIAALMAVFAGWLKAWVIVKVRAVAVGRDTGAG